MMTSMWAPSIPSRCLCMCVYFTCVWVSQTFFLLFSDEIEQSGIKILRGPLRRPHNDLMFQVGKFFSIPVICLMVNTIFDTWHDAVYKLRKLVMAAIQYMIKKQQPLWDFLVVHPFMEQYTGPSLRHLCWYVHSAPLTVFVFTDEFHSKLGYLVDICRSNIYTCSIFTCTLRR